MLATLRTIGFRLAACIAFEWLVYRGFGLTGAVAASPIFGLALVRPLVDLFSEGWHLFRDATPQSPETWKFVLWLRNEPMLGRSD